MGEAVTRAYTGLLSGFDPAVAWRHHELHNQAVASVLDSFLTIRAGVGPEVAERDDPAERRFARLTVATWWFTVEAPHDLNVGRRFPVSELPERLAAVVGDADADGWLADAELLAGADRVRRGSVWVDRRSAWVEASQGWGPWQWPLNDIFSVAKLSLPALLSSGDEELPALNGWEPPVKKGLPSTAREWVSNRFGDSEKMDFDVFASRWQTLLDTPFVPGRSGQDFRAQVLGALNGVAPDAGRKGRGADRVLKPYKALVAQQLVTAEDLERFRAALRVEHSETLAKSRRAGSQPWADWVFERWTQSTGTGKELWKTDAKNAVVNAAQGRLASITSLHRNHVGELCRLHDEASAAPPEGMNHAFSQLEGFVGERTADTGALDRYLVGRRAVKGWPKMRERFAECERAEERIEAIGLLQSEGVHLGDRSLFEWLAERPSCWEALHAFADREDARARARTRLVATITLPDAARHPEWSVFGTNYWPQRASADPRTVVLSMWKGDRFDDVPATLTAGRLQDNRSSRPGAPVAARNDRLGRLAATGTESAAVAVLLQDHSGTAGGTLSLCFDRSELRGGTPRRWFARIAFKMTPAGPLLRFLDGHGIKRGVLRQPERPPGLRVLGVDLGLRTAGAFGVWETVDHLSVAQVARTHGLTPDNQSFAAPSHRAGALGDRTDYYRRLDGALPPAKQGTVAAPWARLVAMGSIEPNSAGTKDTSARPLQWWEQKAIAAALTSLDRQTDLEGFLARESIPWFTREILRAVRANARLASRITRLSNPTLADQELRRWASSARKRPLDPDSVLFLDLSNAHDDPAILAEALRVRWGRHDQALRSAVRAVRLLVFGGRPSRNVAIRIGLPPRRNQPYFTGVPLRLTPERLRVIDDTYRLLVSYWTRPRPGSDHGNGNERTERHAQRIADLRTRLRDDLTKQVASGIVKAALRHGCQVIAVEDLDNLRTRQTNTRATNRMLRRWAKTQILDTVKELCELHGLGFYTVRAAYTSRLDARTGAYGLRYRLEPAFELTRPGSRTAVRIARLRHDSTQRLARRPDDEWAVAVDAYLDSIDRITPNPVVGDATVIPIPDTVAPWFAPTGTPAVAVSRGQRPPGMLDADENAGANIALRWLTYNARNDIDD